MAKNNIKKTLLCTGTFTVPGGVNSLKVSAIANHPLINVMVSASGYNVLTSNGTVVSWGQNSNGALGLGDSNNRSSPVAVLGGNIFDYSFQAGGLGRFFVQPNGNVMGWGSNAGGTLGNNATADVSSPVSVVGGRTWGIIAASTNSVMALTPNGEAYSWGGNGNGQIGDGTIVSKSSPVAVVGGHIFSDIASVDNNTTNYFLKPDGSLWAVGSAGFGVLGDGTVVNKSSPVAVLGSHVFGAITNPMQGPRNLKNNSITAMKSDGSLWAWGLNNNGQLGDGTTSARSSPVAVVGGITFQWFTQTAGASITLGKATNGTLYAWGENTRGALGDGTTINRSSPVAVIGGDLFTKVSVSTLSGSGMFVLALKPDGSAWGWGSNVSGQLADGTVDHRSSPVAVIGGHKFIDIYASISGVGFGLKNDGSLWAWGSGTVGQLGNGANITTSSPVAVAGGYQFANFDRVLQIKTVTVSPGQVITFAVGQGFFGNVRLPIGTTSILLEYEA